ncbi:hypothetical protein ElyMa_003810400 [Elysia marginata]|uniref:Wiskott-Aldrich syndrome protein family member n=1 Tax=Elysia marginata TaxID=1093978 RepID=A0AAV4FDQ4_9GAST|nr:hypothetical protein ElyMa_003810400 [Elysia marginata]
MQEECYVLVHCNSSLPDPVQQHRFSPIVHPALRKPKAPKDGRTVTVTHNHPSSIIRSNSAPVSESGHIIHQVQANTVGFRRMNSSSGGEREKTTAGVNSQHQKAREYHQHPQQQHSQLQHKHPLNGHIFRHAQAERFAYPGFSCAGSTYNTNWTHPCGGSGTNSLSEFRPSVHIPALDLTAITLDDREHDTKSNVKDEHNSSDKEYIEKHKSSHLKKVHLMAEEKFTNKKHQKSPFVFPCEKSLADFDGVRTIPSHVVYEDPASTSPFAQRGRSLFFEEPPVPEVNKQQPQQRQPHHQPHNMSKHTKHQEPQQGRIAVEAADTEKIIHFSLTNSKMGQYVLDEDCPSPKSPGSLKEPQRTRESLVNDNAPCVDSPKNEGFVRRASDSAHNVQEIIDVVVVDGHLHVDLDEKEYRGQERDTVVQDLKLENLSTEVSKEKPKPRVTFSFDHEVQSCRSLKRYTPVKMDIKPLQGVLKKRTEPTQVFDSNDGDRFEGSKQNYFNDSNAVFRKSSKPEVANQGGIRVKHLHTTNFDISREVGKRGTNIPSTMQMAEKPPIPVSRRVALAAAESAITDMNNSKHGNNNNNLLFTGGLTYICSNAQGRVAYFRPSDVTSGAGDMGNSHNNLKVKSRSTEDINRGDAGRFFSTAPAYNNQSRSAANRKPGNRGPAISSPYTLRRSVSTEHGFSAAGSRSAEVGNNKPAKPRVAFGSFIVPKETTPRVKKAQVKYQEVETAVRPTLSSNGTYVHTHTRRTSPYSAPTQVLYDRSGSSSGPPGFRRQYTAQVSKQTRTQQSGGARVYNKESPSLAQRHSAPSSFSSVKDRAWRATVARQRISIDNSPGQGTDSAVKDQQGHTPGADGGNAAGTGFLLPSKIRPQQTSSAMRVSPGAAQPSTGKLASGVERLAVRTLSRPDLSALNMLANRDKGVSQTRFLATLNKTQNRE